MKSIAWPKDDYFKQNNQSSQSTNIGALMKGENGFNELVKVLKGMKWLSDTPDIIIYGQDEEIYHGFNYSRSEKRISTYFALTFLYFYGTLATLVSIMKS
jgi:hypothetical protein